MTRFRVAALVVALALVTAAIAFAFSSSQLLSFTDANGDTADFICTAACPSNSTRLLSKSDFVANYLNNGSCAPGQPSSYIMSYSDEIACRVLTSTISNTTDPWLINNSTSWPTDAGSPSFVTTPLASGAPGGAHSVTSSLDGTATIKQQLAPNPIYNTTTIHATAWLYSGTNSAGTLASDCGGAGPDYSATSSVTLEIVRGDGTVMNSSTLSDGANTWESVTVNTTANSATNYYVKAVVAQDTTSFTNYTGSIGFCDPFADNVTSRSYATDITAGN